MSAGALWLIPTLLGGDDPHLVLPAAVLERVRATQVFFVEEPKSARAFLKLVDHPCEIRALEIQQLNNETPRAELERMLDSLRAGKDAAILSEAGCPALADPGASLVRLAHEARIRVAPLSGPSSVTLALMASGLETQRFRFHGY